MNPENNLYCCKCRMICEYKLERWETIDGEYDDFDVCQGCGFGWTPTQYDPFTGKAIFL